MQKWNLDDLYPGFESQSFKADWKKLQDLVDDFEKAELKDNPKDILVLVELLEKRLVLSRSIGSFIFLTLATNTTDSQANNLSNQYGQIQARFSKSAASISKFLGKVETDITQIETLKHYTFFFEELSEEAQYLLSDEVEEVIARLNRSAGKAWSDLHSYLTSTAEINFKGEVKTLSELRNLAYESDSELRKEAYEAELELYDQIKDSIAFALNNIKSQVIDVAELRGFTSPLEQTLVKSRMTGKTLDALMASIEKHLPLFQRYLKLKAKALGHEKGLPFYDLFAPMGKSSSKFSIEESREFLVETFSNFSPDLADMVNEFYQKDYMDFTPRKGKQGGAFCSNLPFINQSRIMLNFDGSLSNVITIAHELGHAYHGLHIQDHAPLNWSYTMPVAETASTFNEHLVNGELLKQADTDEEKLAIVEAILQDNTQIIVDIYSRYLFESRIFEARQSEFMFSDQLADMMLQAQKDAYGDGLDEKSLHPYMWVNKGHYYSAGLSFYNFPYAFGALYASGLYSQYQQQPEGFVDKYQEMLRLTTISKVEDTAALMGIDTEVESFWDEALSGMSKYVDLFEKLITHN